jgi:small subunit ribosomal protein S1
LPVSQLIPEHYPRVEGGDKKKILKKLKEFIGTPLSVKIISSDMEEEKIIISEKRAWEETQKQKLKEFKIGDQVDATVKSITNFGIFIAFDKDLEGLIHISEIAIPKGKEGRPISEFISINDTIKATIIDIKGTKVFLSLKQTE